MLKDFFITAHGWIQAETIEQAEEEYCETTGWVDSHIVEYLPTGERFDGREYSRAPLAFACSCAGCRQAPRCFENYRYWMRDALALVNGFYFADSTMKFFGCKVSHFYPFGEREGAVFFTTQKNGFDDFTRSRRWVVVCKFGEIVADSDLRHKYPVTAKTLRRFERARRLGIFERIAGACMCHGCQIERAGE